MENPITEKNVLKILNVLKNINSTNHVTSTSFLRGGNANEKSESNKNHILKQITERYNNAYKF